MHSSLHEQPDVEQNSENTQAEELELWKNDGGFEGRGGVSKQPPLAGCWRCVRVGTRDLFPVGAGVVCA